MKRKWIWGILMAAFLMVGTVGCTIENEPAKKEEQPNQQVQDEVQEEVQDEVESPTEDSNEAVDENHLGAGTITIYSQNEDVSDFEKKDVSLEDITPENILAELSAEGVLASDVRVLNFEKKDMDGEQVIELDLSEEFNRYIKEVGSAAEYYIMGSICNTYLEAYHCAKIHITVNGQTLETGHAEYPGYMVKFA